MRKTVDVPNSFTKDRWFRLGCSLVLAFGLALAFLFIPIKVVRVSVSALSSPVVEPSSLSWYSGQIIDLPLPFGIETVRASNGLTITKTANPSHVEQGGIITYTLLIVNQTGAPITDIRVTDTVPIDTECENITAPAQWVVNGSENCRDSRQAVWLLLPPTGIPSVGGILNDGSSATLVYTVRVDQPLPNQSVITNAAFSYGVTVLSPTTFVDAGTIDVTTTVDAPEWQITKSAVPDPIVQAGDSLTYTLTITNSGAFTTSGTFNVVDTIPENTTFQSASGSYVQVGDTITWTIGSPLGPNQSTNATLVVQVDSPLTNGLTITNALYRVTGGTVYSDASGLPVLSTVSSQAELEASKEANAPVVQAGDLITYTLTITNLASASGPADGVVVSDPLPPEVLYEDMGFIPPAAGAEENPGFGNSGVVTWTLSNAIQPGEAIQLYVMGRVTSPLPDGTPITNNCEATADNAPAPAACPPLLNTVASAPSLSLGKTVSPSVNVPPGQPVTYTVVISNTGNETATGLTITDTLDAAFTPQAITRTNISVPGRPTYGTVGTQTVIFTATAPVTPGTYFNIAITATNASTQVTAANLAPIIVGSPDLRIHKSVTPSNVLAGDVLTYTIIYSNANGAPATDVVITDTLGTNLTYVDATPAPTNSSSPEFGWEVGPLNQEDGEQTITIVARVEPDAPNGIVATNSVAITSAQGVGATAGPVNATVLAPELSVVKSDVGYDPIDAGAVMTYTITFSNTGDADAHNVWITDTLDANVDFAWASSTPDVSTPPVYAWDVGDLTAHSGPLTLTVAVTVTQPLGDGTELTNDVLVKGDGAWFDSDSITTTVQSDPIIEVSKIAGPDPATPGETIAYTITFTNVGNAVATLVRITDTLDSNVAFQASNPVHSGTAGSQVYWDWPASVVPNDPQTIVVTGLVALPLPDGTALWNTAEVDSSQGATGTVTISSTVQSAPKLGITKTATPSQVQPGETITYTISYSNTGTASADVVITDTLDPNVNFLNATRPPDTSSPPSYIWNVAGLSPLSGTQVLTVAVTTDPILEDGALLQNNVTISGGGSSDSASASTTVQSVDLSISKSSLPSGSVQAGEWITYTITFSNTGGMDATNVFITDTLPVSLTNVVSSTSPGISFVGGPPPYVWRDNFVAGSSTETGVITIWGQLIQTPWSATGAWLTNTATISGAQAEAQTSNNSATASNLGVPGDPYTITLTAVPTVTTVSNTVPVTATVTDQWGNPAYDGETVTFITSLGTVSPGSDDTQNGHATSTTSSTLPGVAVVTGTINGRSDSVQITYTVGAPHHFVFTPAISSPQTAGVPFSVTIRAVDAYENVVPTYNTSANLADITGTMLPTSTGTGWSGGIWNGTVTITAAIRNNLITATQGVISGTSNLFDVRPGSPTTSVLTVTSPIAPCGATEVQTATVRDGYNNLLWAGTPITFYLTDLGGTGANLVPLSPYVGQTDDAGLVTATIQSANNTGWVRLEVDVDGDYIPEDTKFISISGAGIATDMQIEADPSTIGVGNTSAVTVTLRDCAAQPVSNASVDLAVSGLGNLSPTSGTTNGSGTFTSTFTAGLTPGTEVVTATSGSLSRTTPITITGGPVFTITKTSTPAPGSTVSVTDTITYVIAVTNTGSQATGFVLTDPIPANSGYVAGSVSASPWATISGTNPIEISANNFSGSGQVLTVTFAVTPTGGGNISNQASINSDQTPQQGSNVVNHILNAGGGPATVFLPIVLRGWPPPPDMDLEIVDIHFAGGTAPNPGEFYDVELVVRNDGNTTITADFFVELYLNPSQPPSVGKAWWDLSRSGAGYPGTPCRDDSSCFGRAWLVVTDMGPGDTLTLSTDPATNPPDTDYHLAYDRWPRPGNLYGEPAPVAYDPRHIPIIALADSFGAVSESDEGNNLSGDLSVGGLAGMDNRADHPISAAVSSSAPAPGAHPTLPSARGEPRD